MPAATTSMKKRAVRAVKLFGACGYLVVLGALRTARTVVGGGHSPQFVVLYYHSCPNDQLPVFKHHLDLIEKHATVVPSSLGEAPKATRPQVAITFDDAFETVADNALPELEKRGFASTIYAPSDMLGQSPGWSMREGDPDCAECVVDADRLRSIADSGVTIGSHSKTHPNLPTLDDETLFAELSESKATLEALLGKPVTEFSFPYGAHDDRVVEACRRAGYTRVFGIIPRHYRPNADRLMYGRVRVDFTDSDTEMFLKIHGAYEWLALIAWAKARLKHTKQIPTPSPSPQA